MMAAQEMSEHKLTGSHSGLGRDGSIPPQSPAQLACQGEEG